jgi:hypothetical protein
MNRNTALIVTAASVVLCGCPGLFACLFGAIFALTSQVPGADIDVFGSSDPTAALLTGLAALCVGVILVVIPVAVGFFTLRGASPEAQPPQPQA